MVIVVGSGSEVRHSGVRIRWGVSLPMRLATPSPRISELEARRMTHAPRPVGSVDETLEQRQARRVAQRQCDVAILAAGGETGWWDEQGVAAPWPDDFFDADSEWRPDTTNRSGLVPGEW
jgi:hypothetical protein